MAFTPRLTQPPVTDKRWLNVGYGGYNHCIVRDSSNGNVLPNCTGYVHGRWMEIGNTNTDYNLSLGNADTYYGYNDGFQRSTTTPQLGAVVCFDSAGAGHVCIVEEITDADTIVCSESNYSHEYFIVRTRYRQYGWNPSASSAWGTTFQGFIYHPDAQPPAPVIPTWSVTVRGGSASPSSGHEGDAVTITAAPPPAGQKFYYWQLVSGSGSISNISASSTTFRIGASDAVIQAVYRKTGNHDIVLYYIPPFMKNNEIC